MGVVAATRIGWRGTRGLMVLLNKLNFHRNLLQFKINLPLMAQQLAVERDSGSEFNRNNQTISIDLFVIQTTESC